MSVCSALILSNQNLIIMGMLKEFKEFAMKGSIVDLAVAVIIGGAFGLDEMVLQKAKLKWSLSQLTFPHQLVRLIITEQLYRACTILQNEKYHHK